MMFWYIGGILAGFAIGYVISIAQRRDRTTRNRTTHKNGVNDCRNCKNMELIYVGGTLQCRKHTSLHRFPSACADYQKIEDDGNEE